MKDVIKLLPDVIANQIAAGEVVQRPASVVKELLENSIDAQADKIELILKDAGKTLMQVIDNGKGMSITDSRMSFERHATSKIKTSEDLFRIKTMGFRGEALASIAAVAQVEMKTRTENEELGTKIIIEGSEVISQEPISTSKGTSIAIKNLFFNVPARRNFLKSNAAELRHINNEFYHIALANPNVAFSMTVNGVSTFQLNPSSLGKRIINLVDSKYEKQLIDCEVEAVNIKVYGYVGKPEYAKKTRGEQYFFVNNRYVKNTYLNHAVIKSYEGLLKDGYFPFYVLKIEIDPKQVDINVHPTKTEIKFEDERNIYGIVHSAVKHALGKFNVTPSIDFSIDTDFHFLTQQKKTVETKSDRNYSSFKSIDKATKNRIEQLEHLYKTADLENEQEKKIAEKEIDSDHATPPLFPASTQQTKADTHNVVFTIHDRFLIKQVKSGMTVIDICAALERIMYEKYTLSALSSVSQATLFPQHIRMNASDFTLALALKNELKGMGFEFETANERTIIITGVPAEIDGYDEKELLEGFLEQAKNNLETLKLKKDEAINRAWSKRIARAKSKNLNEYERQVIIDQLFSCKQPNYTPEGKITYRIFNLEEMVEWFEQKTKNFNSNN